MQVVQKVGMRGGEIAHKTTVGAIIKYLFSTALKTQPGHGRPWCVSTHNSAENNGSDARTLLRFSPST